MSNLEHELMAAERALKAIAEMTGADYVHFAWYGQISKFGVTMLRLHERLVHDELLVRAGLSQGSGVK